MCAFKAAEFCTSQIILGGKKVEKPRKANEAKTKESEGNIDAENILIEPNPKIQCKESNEPSDPQTESNPAEKIKESNEATDPQTESNPTNNFNKKNEAIDLQIEPERKNQTNEAVIEPNETEQPEKRNELNKNIRVTTNEEKSGVDEEPLVSKEIPIQKPSRALDLKTAASAEINKQSNMQKQTSVKKESISDGINFSVSKTKPLVTSSPVVRQINFPLTKKALPELSRSSNRLNKHNTLMGPEEKKVPEFMTIQLRK